MPITTTESFKGKPSGRPCSVCKQKKPVVRALSAAELICADCDTTEQLVRVVPEPEKPAER